MESAKLQNTIEGIRRYYPVSDSVIDRLSGHLVEKRFPKNYLLTEPGIRNHYIYFIEEGCARTFFLIDGKEHTNWFSREGDVTFSSTALYHGTPALEYVQLLEDSRLYLLPIERLNHLYETTIEIANWSRVIHQEVLLKMQTLRIDRLSLSAKERYEKFVAENPDLINRVNLGFIASYLGMTQQHLSTLRGEVRF
ncbi:Crp/Fnr family transcriptional regulator [Pedobacter sp. SYSU D00535]|uniref:Crp/Fnr family transcriptional regulator n=1 Tax=Pedobacter sp. SYSU D00535 TaxID=2810308 RepID=UPI001A965193|nr:Crp/Fnr family transcriptional regulator [Pedobacter sp. SYSU D00535]